MSSPTDIADLVQQSAQKCIYKVLDIIVHIIDT